MTDKNKGILTKIRIAVNNGQGESREIAQSLNITTWAEADMFLALHGSVQRDVFIEWSNDHAILASIMPTEEKIGFRKLIIERLEGEAGYRRPEQIRMELYEQYILSHPDNIKAALFTLKQCDFGIATLAIDNPAFLLDMDQNNVIAFSDLKTIEKKEIAILDEFSNLNNASDEKWEIYHPNIAILDARDLPPIEICKCLNIPGYSGHILKLVHANDPEISHA